LEPERRRALSMSDQSRGSPDALDESEHILIFVYEHPNGVREITGGGRDPGGILADIHGEVAPGESLDGMSYENLTPAEYKLAGRI
jgi:hypothetical protein